VGWLGDYEEDIRHYTAHGGSALRHLLTAQGLWALLPYRLARSVHTSRLPRVVKVPMVAVMSLWRKWIEVTTGISLPHTADIGPGLYIGHFGGIIVNGNVVVGRWCNLSQGCTIGASGSGERRGAPRLGDRVYVGANSVVAGKISVGDGAVVSACSLVIRDVPAGHLARGVPAEVLGEVDVSKYAL
jgi:serine O-acetyltransferase